MPDRRSARVLLVIGHGREESLGHHLLDVTRQALEEGGATCRVHDLLADGFDPVLRLGPGQSHAEAVAAEEDPLVQRYQEDVRWADAYIVLHPVWWFAPPAILKGWIDRVLADGVALEHASEPPSGLLGGRRALLVQTFKAPRVVDSVATLGVTGALWRRAVFAPIGVQLLRRLALYGVGDLEPVRLEAFRRKLRRAARALVAGTSVRTMDVSPRRRRASRRTASPGGSR